jgi:hypothetical protein
MGLVAVGIGRLINPLLPFAFATFCFIVLGVLEWREEVDEAEDAGGKDRLPRMLRRRDRHARNPRADEPASRRCGPTFADSPLRRLRGQVRAGLTHRRRRGR